jgi:hypothetical protein
MSLGDQFSDSKGCQGLGQGLGLPFRSIRSICGARGWNDFRCRARPVSFVSLMLAR